jgi:hypothetical protein
MPKRYLIKHMHARFNSQETLLGASAVRLITDVVRREVDAYGTIEVAGVSGDEGIN